VAALGMLLRAMFRRRWRSWLLLSLLVALVSGLVLASAAAGRRTASAFPRFKAAHGYDAFLFTVTPKPKIATRPEVASATPVGAVGIGTPTCACPRPIANSDVSVFEVAPKDLPHVVKLVAGRMPDQSDPYQVLASFSLQQDAGLHVGTVIRVPLYAASQRAALLSGVGVKPGGPTVSLRVVGIEAADGEFPGTGPPDHNVYTTRAFARTVNPKTVVLAAYLVRLRHGPADLPRLEAHARALGVAPLVDLDAQTTAVTSSIRPQSTGWWILAGLAAVAGVIVVAQALGRQAITESEPYVTVSALGVSRRQLVALTMTTTLLIAAAGVAGGVALAVALSPLTPVGEARIAEPSPGVAFDALILVPGAAAAVMAVLALGVWPAVRAARTRPAAQAAPARPSRVVALLTGARVPVSAVIGVRHALERGRDRAAVPVGPAVAGSVLAVTALCATAVFGASLSHLTSTPALYGQPFDLAFSPGDAPPSFSQLATRLSGDRAISDVSLGVGEAVSINGRTVSGIAGQSLRGRLLLTTVTGRLPRADDEVALGATTLRQAGARIGSLVRVAAPGIRGRTRTSLDRVVGTTVFAPNVGTAGLGTGAVLTLGSLLGDHCAPGPAGTACQVRAVTEAGGAILVRVPPGPGRAATLTRLARAYPDAVQFPATPANLANFGQAVNFPLIFGLILVLFGVATLVHLLLVSVARRRPELGLLKALGLVRRQVAFTVLWQATTVALAGIIIGVPAGIAAGRLIWQAFATSLGVVPVTVVTGWVIAAIALGTVLVANGLAIGPSLAAVRSRPASLLRNAE
jgi:FtsX-like permease family